MHKQKDFSSLTALAHYLDRAGPAQDGDRYCQSLGAQSSERWDGNKGYSRTIAAALAGGSWDKALGSGQKPPKVAPSTAPKRSLVTNVAGFAPIVPRHMAGSPVAMLDVRAVPRHVRAINIKIGAFNGGGIDGRCVETWAQALAEIVTSLEHDGTLVTIDIVGNWYNEDDPTPPKIDDLMTVRVKDSHQRLNAQVLYFVCHPAFNRRLLFRWRELNQPDVCADGYGTRLSLPELICKPGQKGLAEADRWGSLDYARSTVAKWFSDLGEKQH